MIWLLMAALAVAVLWLVWRNDKTENRLEQLRRETNAEREGLLCRIERIQKETDEATGGLTEQVQTLENRVNNLESGIVPDFEEAKAAVNAVDEFNKGLSSIMGYDPMEAARKRRTENEG